MKALKLYIPIVAILLSAGCKKEKTIPTVASNLDGSYYGDFAYSAIGATVYTPINGKVSINMRANKYTASSPVSTFGAGGGGHFSISNNQIAYTDTTVHTANFDWGIILNGTYTYTTRGDSLFLTKKTTSSSYTYKLAKTTIFYTAN
ncbi:hypothetical protein [Mucilaginibacter jinjuensis]|uniref:Lipocalin-like protein n=1 Tax=Mucilaginibacter jinjuensis TaxID=1176721 RepID=A0ABY7T1X5_9SPHI|nr:hypothetical protein [Mucilaginibacter jinjuensis]WCT10263.1 hypothetical protein PQO05_16120 [Mucilaginibacter jinjuensis]